MLVVFPKLSIPLVLSERWVHTMNKSNGLPSAHELSNVDREMKVLQSMHTIEEVFQS